MRARATKPASAARRTEILKARKIAEGLDAAKLRDVLHFAIARAPDQGERFARAVQILRSAEVAFADFDDAPDGEHRVIAMSVWPILALVLEGIEDGSKATKRTGALGKLGAATEKVYRSKLPSAWPMPDESPEEIVLRGVTRRIVSGIAANELAAWLTMWIEGRGAYVHSTPEHTDRSERVRSAIEPKYGSTVKVKSSTKHTARACMCVHCSAANIIRSAARTLNLAWSVPTSPHRKSRERQRVAKTRVRT